MSYIAHCGVKSDQNHRISGYTSNFQVALCVRVIVKKRLCISRLGWLSQNNISASEGRI